MLSFSLFALGIAIGSYVTNNYLKNKMFDKLKQFTKEEERVVDGKQLYLLVAYYDRYEESLGVYRGLALAGWAAQKDYDERNYFDDDISYFAYKVALGEPFDYRNQEGERMEINKKPQEKTELLKGWVISKKMVSNE